MGWKILDTGIDDAAVIMKKDEELLESLHFEKDPILHLYQFAPRSATYGHFLKLADFFDLEKVKKEKMQFAKRPTGGGVIFHLWDFAFSALIPATHKGFSHNTLENYATINNPVLASVEEFLQKTGCELTLEDGAILGPGCKNFCMAKPTKYDVMLDGKKIAGAAQRKTKNGFLHQGSISLMLPSKELLAEILHPNLTVVEGMLAFTYPLLGETASLEELDKGRKEIKEILTKNLTRTFA